MIINQLLKIGRALAVDPNQKLPVNPEGAEANLGTIMQFIEKVFDIALNLAVIVGVIMILYSAFLYVSSFGEEAKAETAKKTLLWSVIGTIAVFLARVIVDIVDKFLG